MGIGLQGGALGVIRWLSKQGARVVATDKKSKEELAPTLEKIKDLKNVSVVVGQHRMEDFESADLVIKNPVVPWTDKYIQAAIKKGVPVEIDSSLFFEMCPTPNIIGVTGTKGKTTTASLIFEILKKAGKKPIKAGIGQGTVIGKIDKIKKKNWVIFELSSWRLSALRRKKISPRYAVVTNIFQDHLNYYSSMEKYIRDKKAIFLHQKSKGVVALNHDNDVVREFAAETKASVIYFSKKVIDENNCVFIEEGKIKYNRDGQVGTIFVVEDIKIRGQHNVSNVLAACAICVAVGIPAKVIKEAVADFKGVPHRLEFVKKIDEVSYYNDTTASTPEAAIAGINSFSRPIKLIAGGSNKKLDLTPFAEKIAQDDKVRKVYLLEGTATERLKKQIVEAGGEEKIVDIFESIEEAVGVAKEAAKESEVVLLSPGCASFGMFVNEFERGDRFRNAVLSI